MRRGQTPKTKGKFKQMTLILLQKTITILMKKTNRKTGRKEGQAVGQRLI